MTRQRHINNLISTFGVKKSFLAQKLGISRQVLSYQLNIAAELDPEYYEKILSILKSLRSGGNPELSSSADQEDYMYESEAAQETGVGTPQYKIVANVPAGIGELTTYDDWFETDVLEYNPADHVFIRIDEEFGSSMMPLVAPGDLVLISYSAKPRNGDLVAARWDETKGALKIYQELPHDPSTILLMSYNQAVPVIMVNRKSAKIFKVVLLKKQK